MARKLRLHENGGVYHVMLHGNGGQDRFFDDNERHPFYFLLLHGIARFGHRWFLSDGLCIGRFKSASIEWLRGEAMP